MASHHTQHMASHIIHNITHRQRMASHHTHLMASHIVHDNDDITHRQHMALYTGSTWHYRLHMTSHTQHVVLHTAHGITQNTWQ